MRIRYEHQPRAAFHHVANRGSLGRGDETQYTERYQTRYDRRKRVDNASQYRVPVRLLFSTHVRTTSAHVPKELAVFSFLMDLITTVDSIATIGTFF